MVFRPVEAWNDPTHFLSRFVDSLSLVDVPFAEVVRRVLAIVGTPEPPALFPDSRRVRFDFPPGTVLDLLCVMVRVHGDMTWVYGEVEPDNQRLTGLRYQLTLGTANGGVGIPVP